MRLPAFFRALRRGLAAFVGLAAITVLVPSAGEADPVNGTWTAIAPGGTVPQFRKYFAAIHDPDRERLIVDGGWPDCGLGTWGLSLSGTPAWTQILPGSGTYRQHHPAVYDAPRDRMLFFAWSDCQDPVYDGYVMTLALASPAWGFPTTAGTSPSARGQHTLIYDPVRDRMVLFGGSTYGGTVNDVWELALSGTPTWAPIAPAGTPPTPRVNHAAIYDPVRDVMLVFGGTTPGGRTNELWQLTLGATPTWSLVAAAGSLPDPRSRPSAIYDPVRDRMVVFGGTLTGTGNTNEVWALSLAGTPTWSQLTPGGMLPLVRDGHRAIYDAPRDRMVVYGGQYPPDDLVALEWGETVGIDPTPSATLSLRSGPSPAAGDVTVEFDLPRAGDAGVHVFDVHGRLVRALFEGEAPAGGRRLTWDRTTRRGDRAAPGVYLVRLRFAGADLTRRLVLVD